jgi:hypothetical protein
MHATHLLSLAAAAAIAAVCSAPAESVTIFDSRAEFTAVAGVLLTDDYEDPGYAEFQDDASMNAVKGLTRYETTFFADFDEVIDVAGQHVYSGGFTSGSFRLDFTADSLGGSGVRAVGFDYGNDLTSPYVAFVRFADGSSQNFLLNAAPFGLARLPDFFGLTSDVEITEIHVGLADGGATSENIFAMDDLSVANPVPEPGAAMLLGMGVVTLAVARGRSHRRSARAASELRAPSRGRRAGGSA